MGRLPASICERKRSRYRLPICGRATYKRKASRRRPWQPKTGQCYELPTDSGSVGSAPKATDFSQRVISVGEKQAQLELLIMPKMRYNTRTKAQRIDPDTS